MGERALGQRLNARAGFKDRYRVYLLFRDEPRRPSYAELKEAVSQKFGPVASIAETEFRSFALTNHPVVYRKRKSPPRIGMGEAERFDERAIGMLERMQFWDFPEGESVLKACRWQIEITDFAAPDLHYKERCPILEQWAALSARMLPDCHAVWFEHSGKLLAPKVFLKNPYPREDSFLHGGLNVRFFKVNRTTDMVVDTLGLCALGLPDVQYHFHGLDPDDVIRHAFNVAAYIYNEEAPIGEGDTIDGIGPHRNARWKCYYEDALIEPAREVMNVVPGAFAANVI